MYPLMFSICCSTDSLSANNSDATELLEAEWTTFQTGAANKLAGLSENNRRFALVFLSQMRALNAAFATLPSYEGNFKAMNPARRCRHLALGACRGTHQRRKMFRVHSGVEE